MAKKLTGVVTSDKQDKTIIVTSVSRHTHALYRKQYTRSRKYAAHDEKNEAKLGDRVEIVEVKPISKQKSFSLFKVVEKGHEKVELVEPLEATDKKEAASPVETPVKKKRGQEQ